MSREQGPRAAGMRAPAMGAGRRRRGAFMFGFGAQAAA